jgi:hypothetical protein
VVSKYGEVEQVEFVRGFFCDTLTRRPPEEKYVLIFEDADLVESVHDILKLPRRHRQTFNVSLSVFLVDNSILATEQFYETRS